MQIHPIIDPRIESGTTDGQLLFWDGSKWVHTETSELDWDDTAKILIASGLTVTGSSVLGLNSSVFQPAAGGDSTTFFQILDAGDTPIFNVDSTNERAGFGIATPTGKVHIYTGASGQGSVQASADELVIESDGDAGISILTPNTASGRIVFGDQHNTDVGRLVYDHTDNSMQIWLLDRERLTAYGVTSKLDFIGQTFTIGVDAVDNDRRTDNVRKIGRVFIPHYDIDARDVIVFLGDSDETASIISFGDGTSIGNKPTEIRFSVAANTTTQGSATVNNANLIIVSTGNIGMGEIAPETKVEITAPAPYLTLHNSTHENTDGGRESRIIFKGEKTDESEHTLAMIEVGHDGTGNDQKGYLDIYINDGNDDDSPTHVVTINSAGRFGVGTKSPNAPAEVKGLLPGYVGNFHSGILHVTNASNSEFANAVITGHNSYTTPGDEAGNTQLWYLGSTTGDNNDIAFINRQDGALSFMTNSIERLTITKDGDVGVNVTDPHSKLEVNGAISSATLTITASSDTLDVSGVNTVFINIAADIILGGLVGGVNGQVVNFVIIGNFTNHVRFEHQEGIGGDTQDFINHTSVDEDIDHGGCIYVCNGTNWYDTSHARHV